MQQVRLPAPRLRPCSDAVLAPVAHLWPGQHGHSSLRQPLPPAAAWNKHGTGYQLSGIQPRCQQWQRTPSRAPVAAASLALGRGPQDKGLSNAQHAYDEEIWSVALPALATMLLEPVLSVINASMVGNLGTQSLSSASVGIMVCNFATFLFSFLLFLTTPEVAAAMVKNDRAEVSRICAKTLWVAALCGVITVVTLTLGGKYIIGLIAPPEPEVVRMATQYVGIRAWGTFPVLLGFVATGMFRGFKDTRTPLFAAVGAACSSLCLSYLFIYVLQWGVTGSAMAVAISQGVSSSALCGLLVYKGMLNTKDLRQVPSLLSVLPMLRKGMVLALRNIISFGMILFGSTLCVRAGSTYQAGFEVIRQVWVLTIQFFECLNVATQSLCANYLGAGDRKSAFAALKRILQLGMTIGAIAGAVVWVLQLQLITFFSKDASVIAQVLATMPLVCLMFPLDAAASIMDGSLLAAKHSDYMSVVQIAGSAVQFVVLTFLASNQYVNVLSIWATLKILTIFRLSGGLARNWFSSYSAYKPQRSQAVAPTSTTTQKAAVLQSQAQAGSAELQKGAATPAPVPSTNTALQPPQPSETVTSPQLINNGQYSSSNGHGHSSSGHQQHSSHVLERSDTDSLVTRTETALPDQEAGGILTHNVMLETAAREQGGIVIIQEPQPVAVPVDVEDGPQQQQDMPVAEAFFQDVLTADLVPAHVCCMQAAHEQGCASWHKTHDGRIVAGKDDACDTGFDGEAAGTHQGRPAAVKDDASYVNGVQHAEVKHKQLDALGSREEEVVLSTRNLP